MVLWAHKQEYDVVGNKLYILNIWLIAISQSVYKTLQYDPPNIVVNELDM